MKTNNFSLLLFIAISNMTIYSQICFSTFVNNLYNSAYIGLLIYLIPIIILCSLFNGFKKNINPLKDIHKNKFIKFISIIYLFVHAILLIYFTSVVIKDHYYNHLSFYIIIAGILITCFYLGSFSPNKIINLSTIFFLMILLFNFIPFFHLEERNINLLLPISINKNIIKCYIIFMFPLDTIIFSLNSATYKNGFSKKLFILGNLFSFLLLITIFLDSLSLFSSKYYLNSIFSPFIRWSVYQGNKFFESYDILLLIILIVTTIFRVSYNFSTIKTLFINKKYINIYGFLISFLILIILFLLVNYFNTILIINLIILFVTIFIIYCYIVHLSYKYKSKNNKLGSESNE